ncbi:hypothetical protein, partial [Methylophaga sp. OBS4]|uniref:hypothetical protein n=1 Tax=Methylophaga sp. OBS4 TaxID=2991935 RepID=UPI00225AA0CA
MGIEHDNINNMILMSEELFDRNRDMAGHVWSYFPSLHSELSQAICQPDLVEPNLEFEANDFIHHASLMEININKSYSTQSDKLVIFNLLDSMLALDMNITDLIILAGRLKKCGLKIILSIQPTKKMATRVCHKSVLNAARLFDKGIDFCLRNYNPKNDIQVMMLRCGFVSHVEIDLQCSHALE